MGILNKSNFEGLIVLLDKAHESLHAALKERDFSKRTLENIQNRINDAVNVLEDLRFQEFAKSLSNCANKFNLKTDNQNEYAVIISNVKKKVSGVQEGLLEKSKIDFTNTRFVDLSKVDIKTVKLEDYYSHLRDKQIQTITFVNDYVQIGFVRGGISCISETFITNKGGNFLIPSREGNWEICKLIGKDIISIENKENEVVLMAENGTEISVNTRLGPQGDTFHITVEDFPPLYF